MILMLFVVGWIASNKFRRDLYIALGIGIPLFILWILLFIGGLKAINDGKLYGFFWLAIFYFMGMPAWDYLGRKFKKKEKMK